jgi:1,4-alpha-glucan branching enzyme
MGWMNDTLQYLKRDAIHRCHHQHELSFRMVYAFDENFVLPLSHDEVVHGKGSLLGRMPGDDWQQFAGLRLLYGYQYTTPGKKLLFMGGEFGQRAEWNHNTQLDWHLCDDERHAGIARLIGDLNRVYREEPALHQGDCQRSGFRWISADDAECSVYTWLRFAADPDDFVVVVLNGTPVTRSGYRVGVPCEGFYREILNTDAALYGGSNAGNAGGMYAEPVAAHGQPASLLLTVPPLATLVLKRFRPAARQSQPNGSRPSPAA